MHATDFDDEECEQVTVAGRVDPGQEDTYWEREYFREQYYSPGLDYEDYAPAYCVGYIGYAQYGGEFEEAEKSLCANWVRIKGDSRLTIEQAMPAMRAAWNRMAERHTAVSYSAASSRSSSPACDALSFARASARLNHPTLSISG
jgi:hypothetical protein